MGLPVAGLRSVIICSWSSDSLSARSNGDLRFQLVVLYLSTNVLTFEYKEVFIAGHLVEKFNYFKLN